MQEKKFLRKSTPFYLDNISGKTYIVDAITDEVIPLSFNKASEAERVCSLLNAAYSDGWRDCEKKKEAR